MITLMFFINLCLIIFYVEGIERKPRPRFVVEDSVKPAIFGSYSYNPITQMFDKINDASGNGNVIQIQIFNRTITQSQVTTTSPIHNTINNIFRKHVTAEKTKKRKPFHLRPNILRSKNLTTTSSSDMDNDDLPMSIIEQ